MIELYVFLTLAGIGYMLNKNSTIPPSNAHMLSRGELPSMNTLYDSQFMAKVNEIEAKSSAKSFKRAQNPQQTGVISQTFRDDVAKKRKVVKSNLAGVEIPVEDFTHNNMLPFFGSSIKQSINPNSSQRVMETFTGGSGCPEFNIKKKEMPPMFRMEKDVNSTLYNKKPDRDYYRSRIEEPKVRNNELPFAPVRVGPGLNAGYGTEAVGGYQQWDAQKYFMPKNVDELRTATNPKKSYEGRVLPGMGIAQRGKIGDVNKNRANTFFENTPDRYFTTVGAFTKEASRPCEDVKDTNRQETTKEYMGDAFAAGINKAPTVDGLVKETSRQQMPDFGIRNAVLEDFGTGEADDFGKGNIRVCENERDLTLTKTYEGNLTSLVKSIIAPLEDVFRSTRKELTIQSAREVGTMQPQFPNKATIYDPNDVARTTIKETNIHDTTENGILTGPVKLTVYDPYDITRVTTRNTLQNVDNDLNIRAGRYTGKAYDPDDTMRKTMKETTIDNEREGNIEGLEGEKGAYEVTDYNAPVTQKQFISDRDYIGAADKTDNDGYRVTDARAPTTQRQFLSDNDYYGGPEGENKKPMSYDDIYNATLNDLRVETLVGREPTKESVKVATGIEGVNVDIKKIECDYMNKNQNFLERNVEIPKTSDDIVLTKQKDQLDNEDRLDITMLSGLKTNPYAQKPWGSGDA